MKAMMEVLMIKFDEMISRQRVPSHKEKEVEMPTIKATMNDDSMDDNFKDKEMKFSKADDHKVAMKLVKKQQREIFHTRCHISNKVSSMIIDSESCVIVASTRLAKKLNLNTIKHNKLYKLQ
jgi:hypothetical protein